MQHGLDCVSVLVEDHELAVRLLPDYEPILRGEARLPEPDFLLSCGLLTVSHVPPPFSAFLFWWGVICCY